MIKLCLRFLSNIIFSMLTLISFSSSGSKYKAALPLISNKADLLDIKTGQSLRHSF